eukprot:4214761-Amphidinium_carterae.2
MAMQFFVEELADGGKKVASYLKTHVQQRVATQTRKRKQASKAVENEEVKRARNSVKELEKKMKEERSLKPALFLVDWTTLSDANGDPIDVQVPSVNGPTRASITSLDAAIVITGVSAIEDCLKNAKV